MTLHRNARTCPSSRRLIAQRVLEEGWTLTAAAEAAGVSVPTARKWARRSARGESLEDRSSAPRRIANRTPADRVEAVLVLRRIRLTAEQIAEQLEMAPSTVSLICKREGLGRMPRLEPQAPERRYERSRAGELLHIDVKKLGRISKRGAGHRPLGPHNRASQLKHKRRRATGWDYVHVCVDDATRIAHAEVLADEGPEAAIGFFAPRRRLPRLARDHRRAPDDRQRQRLPLHRARDRLSRAWDPPPAHEALRPAHERQGRALHQDARRRLGLRRDLRLEHRVDSSTAGVA